MTVPRIIASLQPRDLWTTWGFDPGIVIPLALTAILYARGARPSRGAAPVRIFCFAVGWILLAIALVSPLHPLGEALFSAHMTQHEILMLCAAPLLVLSRPLVPMLHGLPFEWRRKAGRLSKSGIAQRLWGGMTNAFVAWWIHAAALWLWHIPRLFDATLDNDWFHAAQHASFFFSALLFWWALFYGHRRPSYGSSILYVFTTAVHTSILGALLTLAPRVWYHAYEGTTAAWRLTPLEDQQIGGLIMWVPASVVYLAMGLTLLAAWMRQSDVRNGMVAAAVCLGALLTGCGSDARSRANAVTGGDASTGILAVRHYGCGSCHTIAGIPEAHGLTGPPLTNLAKRLYIGGELVNSPDHLMHWIRHPHSVNEKTLMPELGVTEKDAKDIAALLYSLE